MGVIAQLPIEPGSARRVRAVIDGFSGVLPGPALDTLRLLGTELVANCVQHGGRPGQISVEVTWVGDHVHLSVRCPRGSARPRLVSEPSRSGGGGFGLRIVDGLACAWGVNEEAGETVVWADVPLDEP